MHILKFTLILLLSFTAFISSTFATDFYWREHAPNNNFSNAANWVTNPDEISVNNPTSIPGTYPQSATDHVFFTSASDFTTLSSTAAPVMGNLTCTAPVKFILSQSTTYTINGNMQSNGNLQFSNAAGTLSIGTITMAGSQDATIDLGTGSPIRFGASFVINKAGAKVELINNDLNLTGGGFSLTAGNFYGNGLDITASGVRFSVFPADLSGSTVTITDASYTGSGNFTGSGLWDFDIVCYAPQIVLSGAADVQFKSLTFYHATKVSINITAPQTSDITIENLYVDAPNFVLGAPSDTYPGSGFKSITISNTFTLQQHCNILVTAPITAPALGICPFNINNIILPPAGCAGESLLTAWKDRRILLKKTGSPLNTTEQLQYQNVTLDTTGATITASEKDDGGGNSGFDFTPAVAQDFFWIGGTGNWNDPAHWSDTSGGVSINCLPTANDNVFFDDNSFFAATETVTLNTTVSCNDITWNMASGIKYGTLAGDNSLAVSIQGNADFSGAVTINPTLYFYGKDAGSFTIYSGTEPVYASPHILFRHEGTYTLESDFIMKTLNPVVHYSGVLDLNGNTMTTGDFISNDVNTTTRNMQFQGGTVNCSTLDLNANNLAGYDFTGSHFIVNSATLYISSIRTLGVFDFNRITCTTPTATINFGDINTSIDTLTFLSNATINANTYGFTVNTLVLTPNKTYILPNNPTAVNRTITVNDTIISNTSECIGLTLNSANATNKGIIKNNSGKIFSIPGATVTNVVYDPGSSSANLQVPGGSDGGGNENIDITAGIPKAYYWIGNTGNWSDPSHWSLTSGIADNPGNCLPGLLDTVYFDSGSFTAPNQTVNQDMSVVNIVTMIWKEEVSALTPTFNVGINNNVNIINLSGSMVLASGMKFTGSTAPNGAALLNFTGTGTDPDSHIIDANGVLLNKVAVNITGKGRFDLKSDLTTYNLGAHIVFSGGSLYTNGFMVQANEGNLQITQSTGAIIDLSTSQIINLGVMYGGIIITITDCANFISAEATLNGGNGVTITNNSCEAQFKSITSGANLTSSAVNRIIAGKIVMSPNARQTVGIINGLYETDSLDFAKTLTITAGRTVTVNEAITATTGTPCAKQLLQGSTVAQGTLQLYYCNPELINCDLMNMNIVLLDPSACNETTQQLYLYGADLGGNSQNVFYDSSLGTGGVTLPDYYSVCIPYVLDLGKGSIIHYEWLKDGVHNEKDTLRTLSVTEPGTYTLKATYANLCVGSFEITVLFSDIYRTWLGNSTDWKDYNNWNPATEPDSCSYVIIPGGLSNYPVLEDNNPVCDIIEFQSGGEVKNTHYLTYNEAKVDMEINSNQWYMLSAPLKNTYSGDFYLNNPNPFQDLSGRGMLVYTMHFNIANYQTGAAVIPYNWNNAFNTNDIELQAGQGFALFANPRNSAYTDQGELSGQPFRFPKNDTFHNYYNNQGDITGRGSDLDRSQNGRFIYEGEMDEDGTVTLAHSSLAENEMVLVGNPFLSQLDFDAFYISNSGLIYEEYKIAYGVNAGQDGLMNDFSTYKGVGGDYITTDPTTDPTLTGYIAPMQSFIVYSRSNAGNLTSDMINHTVTAPVVPANVLRSEEGAGDKELLYITATREAQKSRAVLVHWNEGNKNFLPEEDSRKLLDERTDVPVVVYLTSGDGIMLDINTTNDLSETLPVGIRTSEKGLITLNFSGMDGFPNTEIYFFDIKENRVINLLEQSEYTFDKQDDKTEINDRFYLGFRSTTSIDEEPVDLGFIVSSPEQNTIRVYSQEEVRSVEIMSIDGRIVFQDRDFSSPSKDYRVNGSGVYLVKVMGRESVIKKVIVK